MIGPKSFNKSRDCKGKVLVQIFPKVALDMIKINVKKYLTQVCTPSAHKILILGSLYSFVKELLKSICWTQPRERVISTNKFKFFFTS